MFSNKLLLIILVIFFIFPCSVQAQDKTAPDVKSKPAEVVAKEKSPAKAEGRPVFIEHSGKDAIGGMLALKLKENLHQSSLFSIADKGKKSVRIRVVTRSEFSDRPAVGSLYTIIWTFAENDNVLAYYLSDTIGIVDNSSLELEAEKLTAMTDSVVEQYKFLFE